MKKICVITGSRAEYGLLKNVIKKIKLSNHLKLQLIVTGMHLSPNYGNSFEEIISDGYTIDYKVFSQLDSDDQMSITKSIGLGVIGFADAYNILNPDLILLIGDRFEIFAAAIASLSSGIPVAHVHGGEITEGAFDDCIRHSITKLSHYHFVSADEYKRRVIQLGENPHNVFHVGGLGAENVKNTKLLSKEEIKKDLNLDLNLPSFLVTFHPVTLSIDKSEEFVKELLNAFKYFKKFQFVFTMSNADTNNNIINKKIKTFVSENNNASYFTSLGNLKYLSVMSNSLMVIGNSSSGLLEAPMFNIPTINIGDRQNGRLKPKSVIDCNAEKKSIVNAIYVALNPNFKKKLKNNVSPYYKDDTAQAIYDKIKQIDLVKFSQKKFHDIKG